MPDLKLNHCPFCPTGKGELCHGQQGKDGYIDYFVFVQCDICKASTRRVYYSASEPVTAEVEKKAANLWNRRWKRG